MILMNRIKKKKTIKSRRIRKSVALRNQKNSLQNNLNTRCNSEKNSMQNQEIV